MYLSVYIIDTTDGCQEMEREKGTNQLFPRITWNCLHFNAFQLLTTMKERMKSIVKQLTFVSPRLCFKTSARRLPYGYHISIDTQRHVKCCIYTYMFLVSLSSSKPFATVLKANNLGTCSIHFATLMS